MKRRDFLKNVSLGAASVTLAGCTAASKLFAPASSCRRQERGYHGLEARVTLPTEQAVSIRAFLASLSGKSIIDLTHFSVNV